MPMADMSLKPLGTSEYAMPAARGEEQTSGVIDGPQSVVFDQAENRLHAQKGLLLKLMGADRWL